MLASGKIQDSREHWIASVARLQNRNSFPSDRQSFVFRPLELLGITVGICACNAKDSAAAIWMTEILPRTRKEHTSPWAACLQFAAETTLKLDGRKTPSHLDAGTLADLCSIQLIECMAGREPTQQLDAKILDAVATTAWQPSDIAQAILVFHVVRRVVRRTILSQVEEHWQLGRDNKDSEALVLNIFRRFHRTVQQLQHRYNKREPLTIKDEYDVQDLMHAILLLFFDDVRPETHTPNYAGNSSRTDFVLWKEKIVVETKMTRKKLGQKEIANELIVDKERYSSDTRCKTFICFVYDPDGRCENPQALENDLAQESSPRTRVVVHSPRR